MRMLTRYSPPEPGQRIRIMDPSGNFENDEVVYQYAEFGQYAFVWSERHGDYWLPMRGGIQWEPVET